MGGFLRQVISLSGLWALAELLLPEGSLHKAARLCMSLITMAVLLVSMVDLVSGWLNTSLPEDAMEGLGALAQQSAEAAPAAATGAGYVEAYLTAQANQAENLCLRMARQAGYQARAAVYLRQDGGLERMQVQLLGPAPGPEGTRATPLLAAAELRTALAKAFGAEESQVNVSEGE